MGAEIGATCSIFLMIEEWKHILNLPIVNKLQIRLIKTKTFTADPDVEQNPKNILIKSLRLIFQL